MINIRSTKKTFSVNYPEHITEITSEYFDKLLEGIKVQEHYCIVATCFYDKVFNLITSMKQKRDTTAKVTCLIAKINDNNECDFKQMDTCVITRTELERAVHMSLAHNWISVAGFENYLKGDDELSRKLSNGEYFANNTLLMPTTNTAPRTDSPSIYLVEFKIIPIRDIVAVKPTVNRGECIFKQVEVDNAVELN